jgi:long-chain acyl-CoA synthetase
MPERTIPQLFEESVKRFPDNILVWEKTGDAYAGFSYRQMQERVYSLAAGLQSLGLSVGERVALIAEGRRDWVVAELAVLYSGAINVPVSVKIDENADLKFRLAHSGCKMVICSAGQREKITDVRNDLPDLEKIILLDKPSALRPDEIFIEEVINQGDAWLKENRSAFKTRRNAIRENDCANICYTSGTTADPKGIMLTHRNYTSNVEQSTALLYIPEHYVSLLILPWDHAFAHTAGIYTLMKNGAAMASVQIGKTPLETLKNIPINIKETKPTFLLSVPSLAKSFRKNIEKGIKEKGRMTEKLFNAALALAIDYNGTGDNRGKGLKKLKYPLYRLYDKIIFSKIRENFGGRLEFFVGGGALLDIELQRFFYAIGIPMFQGYGLSESAPVISSNVPACHKMGSSGKVVKDLELKICDDKGNALPAGHTGEIVVKGENVMAGYWKNEKATTETVKDGWLFTGDLGYVDNEGFLYVMGRFKSLLIANDGEKYSPEGIEEAITETSAFISQIMLYNNQSPYTVALIVPNKEKLKEHLKETGLDFSIHEGQDAALRKLDAEISAFKEGGRFGGMFPNRWLPAAVAVLGEGFTEQNHFMNSTLKMVRGKITSFYQNRIDFLYTAEGKDICNHQNRNIVSRF